MDTLELMRPERVKPPRRRHASGAYRKKGGDVGTAGGAFFAHDSGAVGHKMAHGETGEGTPHDVFLR